MEHVWLALENANLDTTAIYGLLLCSLSVQGPKDEQIKLEPQLKRSGDAKVMMGANAKRKFKQLRLTVVQAWNLPKFNDFLKVKQGLTQGAASLFNKTVEPIFVVKYGGGGELATDPKKVVESVSDHFEVNQTLHIPLSYPLQSRTLAVEVCDDQAIGFNLIGCIEFDLLALIQE